MQLNATKTPDWNRFARLFAADAPAALRRFPSQTRSGLQLLVMRLLGLLLSALVFAACAPRPAALRSAPESGYADWSVYGGGNDQIRYSRLKQINRENVAQLRRAWVYDTGDAFPGSELQCNPLVVDGVLYGSSPKLRVFALDAATGKELWTFTPTIDGAPLSGRSRNRGFMLRREGDDRRLYFAAKHQLYALDAETGTPVEEFGGKGFIDLRENLGRPAQELQVGMNTPGVIFRDLLIVGSAVSEGLPSAPGDIRAYDARTGELRWSFHTIPHPGEPGYETWSPDSWKTVGGANNWSGMSLDEERGLVYAGTGSAAFDFWAGNRLGDNLYANSLLCLRAETGELVWHFQFVKHDIWDRDLPAPPSLVTVERGGKLIDAVAQATKSNHVFVFDRETGESLFPLEEVQAAATDIDGEETAPKQILPLAPPALGRQQISEADLTERTPEARKVVLERFRKLRNGPQFTPPSREGTIVFPGFDGGLEWGGQAFDPETGLYYGNSNVAVFILRLVKQEKFGGVVTGKRLYQRHCAACHLDDLSGAPPEFPALAGLGKSRNEIEDAIKQGAGRMPAFGHLGDKAAAAIARFILAGENVAAGVDHRAATAYALPWTHDGYNKFLDPDGYPPIKPPWGTLTAVNLDSGAIAWRIPFGEHPELVAQGMAPTGTENYGGPIVTAGGLLFIGATNHDKKFRAFDKADGELLWETTLPASGNATPAMYEADGRQFIAIAAGGGKSGAESGGKYVAFALP